MENESGSLFDDPVSGVVNILDFEVTHAIRIAPQQRRRDHRIFASMQHSNRHIDAAVCVSATNQPRNSNACAAYQRHLATARSRSAITRT